LGYKDVEIGKSEFVAKAQLLCLYYKYSCWNNKLPRKKHWKKNEKRLVKYLLQKFCLVKKKQVFGLFCSLFLEIIRFLIRKHTKRNE